MRGIHYKATGEFLPNDYAVQATPVLGELEMYNFQLLRDRSKRLVPGPGIEVAQWLKRQDDILYAFYTFRIWDVVTAYGVAAPSKQPVQELATLANGCVVVR